LQPQYTLWGKVIKGLDIIKKVGEGLCDDGAYAQLSAAAHPKTRSSSRP
jgi:cyclophilin family peptidyl-prolyl cis-trans isomerase